MFSYITDELNKYIMSYLICYTIYFRDGLICKVVRTLTLKQMLHVALICTCFVVF